jgi:hypothetical protein
MLWLKLLLICCFFGLEEVLQKRETRFRGLWGKKANPFSYILHSPIRVWGYLNAVREASEIILPILD